MRNGSKRKTQKKNFQAQNRDWISSFKFQTNNIHNDYTWNPLVHHYFPPCDLIISLFFSILPFEMLYNVISAFNRKKREKQEGKGIIFIDATCCCVAIKLWGQSEKLDNCFPFCHPLSTSLMKGGSQFISLTRSHYQIPPQSASIHLTLFFLLSFYLSLAHLMVSLNATKIKFLLS